MKLYTDNYVYNNAQSLEYKKFEKSNHKSDYHFHSQVEIIECLSGAATIDLIFESINLVSGETIIIPPYEIHSIEFREFNGASFIFKKSYIETNYKADVAKNLLSIFYERRFLKLNDTSTQKTINSLEKNIKKPDFGYSFLHIADLLISFKERGKAIIPYSEEKSPLLQKIISYIYNNIDSDLSLASISKQFGVTEFHICRIFKNEINTTPVTYITNIRISAACKLLLNTNTDIKKISELCGFKSHTYFHNIFKENFCITPSKYRQERK